MSGSADGTVQIRDTGAIGSSKKYHVFGWKNSNVGAVSASLQGGVYCGSKDGCFQVWRDLSPPLPD